MKIIYYIITATILFHTSVGNMVNPMTRAASPVDKPAILNDLLEKSPPCVQLFYYTKYYCKIYGVPERVAFRILRQETGYKGPSHLTYKPSQTSSAYALGPWQVLFSTGKDVHDDYFPLTRELLLNDIQLNTKIGIKYLAWLYNQPKSYGDWERVAGFYNTGYWQVNGYAQYAAS